MIRLQNFGTLDEAFLRKWSTKTECSKGMRAQKGTLRTCKNGHNYYKSSDCPTCPECEKEKRPKDGFLSLVSAPARKALENNGITTLKKLAKYTEQELLQFHGLGKSSLPKLAWALAEAGLSFREK